MTDIHWTNYVAMVTGIAGCVLGLIGYTTSKQVKSRDMRIGLRKDINHAVLSLEQLQKLLPHANESCKRIAAATRNLKSACIQLWGEGFTTDTELLAQIVQAKPNPDSNYESLSQKELEKKLIDIHRLQGQIDQLSDKYKAAIQEDDQIRTEIREDHRGGGV